MVCRGRVRAVDETMSIRAARWSDFPNKSPQATSLKLLRDAPPVVIMNLQTKRFGTARDRAADASHSDNAEPLIRDTVAEHPGWRPTLPFLLRDERRRTLSEAPRHRENKRHRHIRRIFRQDARRVGYGNSAGEGCCWHIYFVDAVSEIRHEF